MLSPRKHQQRGFLLIPTHALTGSYMASIMFRHKVFGGGCRVDVNSEKT